MFPFIELFGKTIGMYGLMTLVGILAAGFYSCRIAKKMSYDDNELIVFLLISSIGLFFGGHILYALVNYKYILYLIHNTEKLSSFYALFDSFRLLFGGSVFYGGLLGGIAAAYLYAGIKKRDFAFLSDICAPAIPLFHFFGRIACFLGGCCFGIEHDWGFTFHNSLVAQSNGVQRFPVQLLEALFNLALFFCLMYLQKRIYFDISDDTSSGKRQGRNIKNLCGRRLLFVYLMSYSTGRFFLEYLRGDSYRGHFLLFSTSQFIALVVFSVSLFLFLRGALKKNPPPLN
ncbi:MAG: prolipoprotein diacylglyceryl transferase [Spirochaetaceae bacterium]|jgi:phosphatidylglycerol:prolipoprotein diacylglycerol transferase|nr:prolipoprotein diacylglyceryl transferase [Spirochaetaceae bacterium]